MDLSLFFIIFAIILAIPAIRNIRESYIFNEELREQTKSQKLRNHLIQNMINDRECCCTPECLKQTKDTKLIKVLRTIPLSHSGGLFVPLPRASAVTRAIQYVQEESHFGTAP